METFGFTIDFLVAQAEGRSGGQIRFPYAKQKNCAWFDFRTYGLGPGTIYGESGAVPPLQKGHVVTDLAGWGKLHAFRTRSPFGSAAVFVVLVSDPVDGATARLNAHIRSGEKQLTISEFPYEFSLDRVEMHEDVSIEFTISGAKGRPERSARLSLSGGRG